ncbi:TAXI family TRAP transporter solute-binding subunit [Rhodoligotrophos ferricapiens]|uniref:TAXI family TRAP transporter solute-binding subunit n=1 Tax=Rhodoligotrophos ferricapiens TaxID=3069264 RepID=UPI00315CB814
MKSSVLIAIAAAIGLGVSAVGAETPGKGEALRTISIGTGGVTGVYYPVSGAICRLINERRQALGLFCTVQTTDGSVENIRALERGAIQFAIVQADVAEQSYLGTGGWQGSAVANLRKVMSLYAETVTIIAHNNANIRTLADLKGKRIGIGNTGSGSLATWRQIQAALGWSDEDIEAVHLTSTEQGQALCDDTIDAFIWLAGHPSASTEETLAGCDAHLIDVTGPAVDAIVKAHPEYRKMVIPADVYDGQAKAIESFGTMAALVTSEQTEPAVVAAVTQTIIHELGRFAALHPALREVTTKSLAEAGEAPPWHSGAEQAFAQAGLR